jgi:Tir chaperone protein (CesT) family
MANELESLTARFAQRHGLAEPRRDDAGQYHYVLDGEIEIAMFQHGDQILLEGRLGALPSPADRAGEILRLGLRRHLGRLRDHSEALTLDPDTGELMLYRRLQADQLDERDFESAIGALANGLASWKLVADGATHPAPSPRGLVFRP